MQPDDLVDLRVCPYPALEVDVVALSQVVRVKVGAELQANLRGV